MSKVQVIIEEKRELDGSQRKILDKEFGDNEWELNEVPQNEIYGWKVVDMLKKVEELKDKTVVLVPEFRNLFRRFLNKEGLESFCEAFELDYIDLNTEVYSFVTDEKGGWKIVEGSLYKKKF